MHTISLHNIRYELRSYGTELWQVVDGRATLRAMVTQTGEGGRWEVWGAFFRAVSFEDEQAARDALVGELHRLMEQND